MPSADRILSWATSVANDWRPLAIAWHVVLATVLMAFVIRQRPSSRVLGLLLVVPLVSVALVAWASGNPFNGLIFSVLVVLLLRTAVRWPQTPISCGVNGWGAAGVALVAFGWAYPHFLRTDGWIAYAYASPLGLLPCPTLAVVIGITLMCRGLQSTGWSLILAAAGILYGLIGVFVLRVPLDVWLLAGAALLGVMAGLQIVAGRVQPVDDERRRQLPGDDLVCNPSATLTHAITIRAAAEAVWPWLVQMGAGSRAGWYSYDFLDNGRRRSATRIVPELQHITLGTLFPAMPGVTEGFVVLLVEPPRSLVVGWPGPDRRPTVTWAFVLEPRGDATRLIVRVRAGQPYRFHQLPAWLSVPLIRLVHFVMQRKQLLEISRRVESSTGRIRDAA